MSGYPYGGPPPTQPYGGGGYDTSPAGYGIPYGVGAPSAAGEKPSKSHKVGDYHPSAPPSSAPYAAAASQYSGVEPSKTGYQPSAPPAAGPYGGYVDPYSAGSEKPSKAQQGGGYDDPYSEKPSKAQKGGGYGDSYSEKPSKPQQGTVTPTAATDSINSPEGFLLEWWSVFWDIFIARTNEKHSPAAAAYIEEQRSKARQQHLDFKHQQDQLRRRHANYPALNGAMVPLSSNGQAAKIRQEVQGTCGQQILERMHNPTDIKGQLGVAQRSLHDPSLIYGQGS